KRNVRTLGGAGLEEVTRIAHAISEITNIAPFARQPYIGASAFAHKAGLHASAIRIDPDLYQHVDPRRVGNDMRMLVSDMAGRPDLPGRTTDRVKDAEANGYTFDAADASFDLLLREEVTGRRPSYFRTESWRAIVEHVPGNGAPGANGVAVNAEATVKLHAG